MHALTRRIAAVLLLLAATVAAQTNATNWNTVKALTAGTDVRIRTDSRTVNGRIDRISDDTLVLTSESGQEVFKPQDVVRVSVRTGSHRKRNLLIGAGIGAGGGLALGGAAAGTCSGTICGGHGPAVVAGVAGAGALVGTLIGVAIPTGGWREIYKK
jgi:hypothetical protein